MPQVLYALDGIPLDNPTYNWVREGATDASASGTAEVTDLNSTNRDGTIQIRGRQQTRSITLVVTTPTVNEERLRKLFRLATAFTRSDFPNTYLAVEDISITSTPLKTVYPLTRVGCIMRVPFIWWRDIATSTWGPSPVPASGTNFSCFTASTGRVTDALISVGGSITNLQITGTNGTYFTYAPNIPAGTYLTFDAKSGRAWTGTTPFAQTTEVTGSIANGPGPYYLELDSSSSDPSIIGCIVRVNYASQTGATIAARGVNAYDR